MTNRVYRMTEVVGSSTQGIDDAIQVGIERAAQTVRNIDWFDMQSVRGQVVDGQVAHWQVTIKLGFRVDD